MSIRLFGSIRAKITLGIVALLVMMTIVTAAVAMERSEDALRNQITLTHEERAKNAAQRVDLALDRAKDVVQHTASMTEMQRMVDGNETDGDGVVPHDGAPVKRLLLDRLVDQELDPAGMFHAAFIVDPAGRLLLGQPLQQQDEQVEASKDPSVADRYARVAEFTAQVPSPVVYAGGFDGKWTISMRLMDADDAVWGVLLVMADTAALETLIGGGSDEDTFFLILDHTGIVLIGAPGFDAGTDLSQEHDELRRSRGASGIIDQGGREYLATAAPLGEDWRMIVAQDSRVAFAPVTQMLATILLVAGLVVAGGVVTGLFVASRITAPVVRLKRAAERMAEGEYGTQVRTTSRDELAELAGAFNVMSARLLEEHERVRRHQESLEATVKERTRELAEKNEELEAFVYAASHDLRTPLITLDWLVEELEDVLKEGDQQEVQRTLERVRSNIDGMDSLIEDLLELSRIGRTEGEPQAVMLRPLVESVVADLEEQRRKRGISLHIHFDDSVVVEADPRRMEQVFQNLLSNALKYGHEGGQVHLRASAIGDERRPWKWRVEVADDGPGVPSEQREAVFQLFRRGPQMEGDEVGGTGVGLAVVRKIIRSYGGEVKAAQAPEGGALFWFTLNAARPGAGFTSVHAPSGLRDRAPAPAQGPRAGKPVPRGT